ncbi:MAG: IS630 family transposase, partial [Methanosarcinales archaeon]
LKETIAETFKKLTKSISSAKNWIEKFLDNKFKMLCT